VIRQLAKLGKKLDVRPRWRPPSSGCQA
jgi:hypothetical protein